MSSDNDLPSSVLKKLSSIEPHRLEDHYYAIFINDFFENADMLNPLFFDVETLPLKFAHLVKTILKATDSNLIPLPQKADKPKKVTKSDFWVYLLDHSGNGLLKPLEQVVDEEGVLPSVLYFVTPLFLDKQKICFNQSKRFLSFLSPENEPEKNKRRKGIILFFGQLFVEATKSPFFMLFNDKYFNIFDRGGREAFEDEVLAHTLLFFDPD